jgi:hypothetical protein
MSQTKAQLISDLVQALNFTGTASAPANGAFLSATNTLALATNSAQRLTIDSSGRLLLGTTTEGFSEGDDLTINSADHGGITIRTPTNKEGNIAFSDTTSGTGEYSGLIRYRHLNDDLGLWTASNLRLLINSSGNVGIGESASIDARLHINSGTDNATLFIESTDGDVNLCMADNAGSCRLLQSAGDLHFRTGGNANAFGTGDSERMVIDSSGNVGIGTTSPSDHLTVSHSANTAAGISITNTNNSQASAMAQLLIAGGDNSKGRLKIETNGAFHTIDEDSNGNLILEDNGTERMRIDSSGRLLLGTTTEGATNADEFTLATSGHTGITIRSGTTHQSAIYMSDATSGDGEYAGYVLYDHNVDALRFGANTSDRMRIDSSGRLLLGASTSAIVGGGGASLYQIETTSQNAISCVAHRGTGNASGSIFILGKSRGTSAGAVTSVGINDELGSLRFAGADDTDLQSRGGEISCEVDGTPGSNDMPGRLLFKTTADGSAAPTERMRIDSSGTVLLSGSRDGNSINNATLRFNIVNSSGAEKKAQIISTKVADISSTIEFGTTVSHAYAERMRIHSDGNVGIGTTSPSQHLVVSGTGSQYIAVTSTNSSNTGVLFGDSDIDAGFVLYANSDDSLRIGTGGANERMRITSNGFSKHTSDSGNYVSSTGNYHEFRSNSGNNPNTIFFHNGVGNTQFGIKIQTANEQNDTSHHFIDCREGGSATRRFIVYANGNVQNSNNSYGQLSDIKLKENVVDSNSQWNDIKQLKVRNFNFKNDNTNLKQIGLIAQEAEIVCPSLVFESQDQEEDAETGEIKDKGTTTKSVKYSVLYMKAIKCLQEAMARIEALETKVAVLEAA